MMYCVSKLMLYFFNESNISRLHNYPSISNAFNKINKTTNNSLYYLHTLLSYWLWGDRFRHYAPLEYINLHYLLS